MITIPSRSTFRHASPPAREKLPNEQSSNSQETPNLTDSVDKSRESGWSGIAKASLAALGLVTVATGVAQAQTPPTEMAMVVDSTQQAVPTAHTSTEARIESKKLDVEVSQNWRGNLDIKGDWGGSRVDLNYDQDWGGNKDINGKWGNQKVDLEFDKTFFGNYELDGKWGGQTVDLEIDKTLLGNHDVTGRWGDAKVDLDFDKDWSGNYDIDGTWNGQKVDLDVSRTWNGSTQVKGHFGNANVDFTASRDWRGNLDLEGEAPQEAVVPWLLSNHIQQAEAQAAKAN